MQLEVIQVKTTTKPTKNGGSYQETELTYKDLGSGKIQAKKVMSFADKAVFETLSASKQGDVFTVQMKKNEQSGYWDWTGVEQAAPVVGNASPGPVNKVPRSTYETPEERAKRQVYIIKQSSVSTAVNLLSVGAKTPPALPDVLKTAQEIYNYVTTTSLADMEDDDVTLRIPEVQ